MKIADKIYKLAFLNEKEVRMYNFIKFEEFMSLNSSLRNFEISSENQTISLVGKEHIYSDTISSDDVEPDECLTIC